MAGEEKKVTVKQKMQKMLDESLAASKAARLREATLYILREWVAQTVGAPPDFAADNADAARTAAKMYIEACDAMVFDEPEPEPEPE